MNELKVDKEVFRTMLANQRQDIRRGICTKSEAMEVLGLQESEFYKEKNDTKSRLRQSKKRGKYIWSSVLQEFERVHGVKYSDAVVHGTV